MMKSQEPDYAFIDGVPIIQSVTYYIRKYSVN